MSIRTSGLLVTAAFIGPGTVTTATLAGASFGYSLVWALVLSVIATIVMQNMACRVGLVTGQGLAGALHHTVTHPMLKWLMMFLVAGAIGIGNAAYEAGNISGAVLGLSQLLGGSTYMWILGIGAIAGYIIVHGNSAVFERLLVTLVCIMSAVFILTFALLVQTQDLSSIFIGLVPTDLAVDKLTLIIALIGTTLVPYNLFLQSSMVARDTQPTVTTKNLKAVGQQNILSIGLGGLVTFAIMGTAASTFFALGLQVEAGNIALQLTPLLGEYAQVFFALGLLAAGLTSAMTAPIAGAYALSGVFKLAEKPDAKHFKMFAMGILVSGVGVALLGFKPILAIIFAQATNALLLPFIAIFLLLVMNNKRVMHKHTNNLYNNVLTTFIVLTVSALGLYKLVSLFL
ncbi:Nramp family divalent metal transporter [Opacimonas viscosa]|uniref:Nramp family divalent metal transporter n=1 Tax=Opacimonas viscosa TaxID=2961944 RepID=A0AA41X3M4_9ALTE|nr:Nramp family divalent metal transporter [Opacimonas viscosa]MCP3429378.1 Nramp family divalent metal transporter [Opacimonas viscosa]